MIGTEQTTDGDLSDGSSPRCTMCGVAAESGVNGAPPLGWSAELVETSAGIRPRWACAQCTRQFVRSIEAKLDPEWW
ncbi:hypothetical protein [uncultured Jatrophihabitans sp.]|uniref:hypothetical protein n=1 Tax=uncultured Jatrophihabitans sp. TaxID=1610747 RepID=UPI0035CC5D22